MIYLIIIFALVGLCVGSFLNVIIYRLPQAIQRNEPITWQIIAYPSSYCPHCQKPLKWFDLIPVISFFYLKQQCRTCHISIAWQYPLVEVSLACLYVLCFWHFGLTAQLIGALLFCSIILALIIIDFKTLLLPDALTLPLLWLGLLLNTQALFTTPQNAIGGAIIGYTFLYLLNKIMFIVSHKEGMGYGDFKMTGALGAWFGYQALAPIILMATLSSLLLVLGLIIFRQRSWQQAYPFGPFLGLASISYLLLT